MTYNKSYFNLYKCQITININTRLVNFLSIFYRISFNFKLFSNITLELKPN